MKTAAFITIKLNSERLPNKNIHPRGDHPLSWHICSTLLNCRTIDEIYIYCSEERIMEYVPRHERLIFRKRDKRLDGSLIRAQDTYSAFIGEVDADIYLAALTTAPFLSSASIDHGVEQVLSGAYDSAFSAQKLQTFAWYKGEPLNYSPERIPRTQDMEPVYIETSGFFAFKRELWTTHQRRIGFRPYLQLVDQVEAIDIDTKEDYEFAQRVMIARR